MVCSICGIDGHNKKTCGRGEPGTVAFREIIREYSEPAVHNRRIVQRFRNMGHFDTNIWDGEILVKTYKSRDSFDRWWGTPKGGKFLSHSAVEKDSDETLHYH